MEEWCWRLETLRWMRKMWEVAFYNQQSDDGMDLVLVGTDTKREEEKKNKKRNECAFHVLKTSQYFKDKLLRN